MTRRNNMRGLAMIVALFMCTACGQASTPSAPSTTDAPSTSVTTAGLTTAYTVPENIETTTTTVAEVTTEAQREEETKAPETEVTEPETTAVETEVTTSTTEETTMIVTIETTGKVEDAGEAKAPETEATTEETTVAETEAANEEVDRSSLPSETMLDVKRNGKGNSSVIASVLVYYGIDCTSDDITGADDVATKDVDGMISVINSFIASKGGGYEAVDMSGYTLLEISDEISKGNPVFYWDIDVFGTFYGYSLDSADPLGNSDGYYYIDSKGGKGVWTGPFFYDEQASALGWPAIVIHKK